MYLIPVPDHPFFRWQMITQITAMEELGLLSQCHWLMYTGELSPQLRALIEYKVAKITVWPDWPRDSSYNGAMKPWLIGKWLSANPEKVFDNYIVIDPDVIPITTNFPIPPYGEVYGTDTDSYTGPGYLKSKDVFKGLCDIVGVDSSYAEQFPGIGAQLSWRGLSGQWWEEVAQFSITAHRYMVEHPSDIQAWCSEMYITQLCLIRDGWVPRAIPDMDMVWANGSIEKWNSAGFFHDAGVTEANPNHFCKLQFNPESPFGKEIAVSETSASRRYIDYIRKTEKRFEDIIKLEQLS